MKKIYFIQRTASHVQNSARWRHTLKRTYKSTDAVRDIIQWSTDGHEFYVAMRDVKNRDQRRLVFHINPPGSNALMTDFATKRPVVGVIDLILQWTHEGRDFDITLLMRKRSGRLKATKPQTSSRRLRVLGKVRN
ncbi:MAG: hypothetical protein L6Q71_00570 [Planctomycetes bacterium]|nr:hypothetical protein [Planctomycetota bacterium]NUQ35416.1 hypothetical protein [Planctomycetaceae bacterium]